MRQNQQFDLSGWRVRWNEGGQVEFSTDGGQTWKVFA
jgi:hypothetical protein